MLAASLLHLAAAQVALAAHPRQAAGPDQAATAAAKPPAPAASSEPAASAEAQPPDPRSPRASLKAYLDACRQGHYSEAARYLDLSRLPGAPPEREAMRLKEVLDRHLWFDMESISPEASGNTRDGLPPHLERLGTIPAGEGARPVEMARQSGPSRPAWRFSPATVASIDAWYRELRTGWLADHLPAALLRPGPLELQWWQWLALPLVLLLAFLAGRLGIFLVRMALVGIVRRTRSNLDDLLMAQLQGPAILFLSLAFSYGALPFLSLTVPAEGFVTRLIRAAFLAGLFWTLSRLLDVSVLTLERSQWLNQRESIRSLTPFMNRAGRLIILALGTVTILQEFGFQITGLLAGMGLAGMAVALAGQKSLENLLGSATLLADRPFKVNDFVRIGDLVGTIEQIGLRSTRIRTLDRTRVTIPNGQLSEMRLETFAARDRIRLICTLGLTYSTTSTRMRQVIAALEDILRRHPHICMDMPPRVRFVEFASSSLNLEVYAYLKTTDWGEFLKLREEIFLQFMEAVEACGCAFAFPTRTVVVEKSAEISTMGEGPSSKSTAGPVHSSAAPPPKGSRDAG
ncbi:MAG: mechanosensitive ion channel family protein [Acidobacteriota bacterium]